MSAIVSATPSAHPAPSSCLPRPALAARDRGDAFPRAARTLPVTPEPGRRGMVFKAPALLSNPHEDGMPDCAYRWLPAVRDQPARLFARKPAYSTSPDLKECAKSPGSNSRSFGWDVGGVEGGVAGLFLGGRLCVAAGGAWPYSWCRGESAQMREAPASESLDPCPALGLAWHGGSALGVHLAPDWRLSSGGSRQQTYLINPSTYPRMMMYGRMIGLTNR